ncbi:MAG: ribokinase [Gaiellales bacterium]|nr:ribokinase [Gaiellales bacterium]
MHIAVVGSYGVGMTMYMDRMPAEGETLVGTSFAQGPGGKGSNQAIAARRLGARVTLCSIVGPDALGAEARRLWDAEGIGSDGVQTGTEATMVGFILVDGSGSNRIVIAPGALSQLRAEHVQAVAADIETADVVLVGLEIPVAPAAEALRLAAAAGVVTVLNPAPATRLAPEVLQAVRHITPNRTEAAVLTGLDPSTPAEKLLVALRVLAPSAVIALTLGGEGVLVYDASERTAIPAVAVAEVVDTAGAGDAFSAAYAVAIAEGRTPVEAARFGVIAGAFAVTRREVVPGLATRAELDAFAAARP